MIVRPTLIIDLLAILPFYLSMVITLDGRALRAFRLLRVFRIFTLGRYSKSLQLMGAVLREKTPELAVILFAVIILLVATSSLMYFVEHEA
jgi:voltage-gated potassium channel